MLIHSVVHLDGSAFPVSQKAVKTLRRKSCETNVRIKEQFAGIHQHLTEANMRQDYLALEIDNCRDIVTKMGQEIRDNVWGTGMIKNGVCHDYVPCFQDVINEQKRAPCDDNLMVQAIPVVSYETLGKTDTSWFSMLYPNDLDLSLYHGCVADEITSDFVVKGRKTTSSWKKAIGAKWL